MKKAIIYALIGAATYKVIDFCYDNKCCIEKHLKRFKKSSKDCIDKVKAMF